VGSLTDLLFELSSEDRIAIMRRLSEEPLKLSHVANRLDITVTESSRHLQRLSDTGLIQKDADGLYEVTPYGSLVLSLVPGLDFASRNRSYFAEHSSSVLPPKFTNRIGELSAGKRLSDTMTTFAHINQILSNAEEFAFSMNNNPIPLRGISLSEKNDTRSILQEGISLQDIARERGAHIRGDIKRRFLPNVQVFILVTEKEAMFSLPYLNGNIDYCSFTGKDPGFRGWCGDLFLHFWEEARPNPSISS